MLKLYLPTLRILVLLIKSVVNSHATMIMAIGNNHQGSSLDAVKWETYFQDYPTTALFLPFLQSFFSNPHGFALLHPMIVESTKNNFLW